MIPALARGEVHILSASLQRSPEELGALAALLSPDERERAGRFRFERDRDRFVAGRGLLRTIVGAYSGRAPGSLSFAYGEFDKPSLEGDGPWFNLAHSGAVALLAVSTVGELGVDVELEPPDFDYESLAARFFSAAELDALRAVPELERARSFLECWTRKEAFVKARGDGLQLALDSFDVSLGPGIPAGLRRVAWSEDEPGQWTIRDVSDRELGYVGAMAIRATGVEVVHHRVPNPLSQWATNQEDR